MKGKKPQVTVSHKGLKSGYPQGPERISKTVPSPNYPRSNSK